VFGVSLAREKPNSTATTTSSSIITLLPCLFYLNPRNVYRVMNHNAGGVFVAFIN
jgi:hypothetical protein